MKTGIWLAAAAAISMGASPVLAAPANPAASLSIGKSVRAGNAQRHANGLAGTTGGFLIAGITLVIVIAAIVLVTDDKPASR